MATISDTLTMGIVLAVILGSLFFYLYTRLLQVEKRISLTENILLDLKMATENTLLMMGSGGRFMGSNSDNEENQTEHVEATTDAQPLQEQEVEELKEEDFYKSVLQNASVEPTVTATVETKQSVKMDANYEALTKKELQESLKQRGLTLPKGAGRKEMIDTLKKNPLTAQAQVPLEEEVKAGSESTLSAMDGAELIE
jgi:hypothetical protein